MLIQVSPAESSAAHRPAARRDQRIGLDEHPGLRRVRAPAFPLQHAAQQVDRGVAFGRRDRRVHLGCGPMSSVSRWSAAETSPLPCASNEMPGIHVLQRPDDVLARPSGGAFSI